MEYAQFKPFYAGYWNVSPETLYRVIKYSNSRASVYLMGVHGPGSVIVPVSILEFKHIVKWGI